MDDRPQNPPPRVGEPHEIGEQDEAVRPDTTAEPNTADKSNETDAPMERGDSRNRVGETRQIAALDPPMVPLAVGGLVIWAVVGLSLLPFHEELADNGNESWPWICLAGFLIGIPGLITMIRHDANRRRRRTAAAGDKTTATDRER